MHTLVFSGPVLVFRSWDLGLFFWRVFFCLGFFWGFGFSFGFSDCFCLFVCLGVFAWLVSLASFFLVWIGFGEGGICLVLEGGIFVWLLLKLLASFPYPV